MTHRTSILLSCSLFALGACWGLGFQGAFLQHARGQFVNETNKVTREQRYADLQREADFFDRQSRVVNAAAELMGESVVHIEAEKIDRNSRGVGLVEEAGSGVIVQFDSKPGEHFVLTNAHVIRNAQLSRITIKLSDGRIADAERVWTDPATAVAVVRLRSMPRLVAARLADSDSVGIGQFVLAMGSPFGLSHSITFGIISAKGRRDLELGNNEVKYQDFMQTDAAINPGNSGGPLVNLRGEVIGINTAIASNSGGNEGIGFSIPINMVVRIARQLIEHGGVMRAFLGVTLDPKFGAAEAARLGLPSPRGAKITGVRDNTPASNAQLREGDVVLEFNGVRIDDDAHLINVVSLTDVGDDIPITIWRNREVVRKTVRVGDRAKLDTP